jgi:hypothetical protein
LCHQRRPLGVVGLHRVELLLERDGLEKSSRHCAAVVGRHHLEIMNRLVGLVGQLQPPRVLVGELLAVERRVDRQRQETFVELDDLLVVLRPVAAELADQRLRVVQRQLGVLAVRVLLNVIEKSGDGVVAPVELVEEETGEQRCAIQRRGFDARTLEKLLSRTERALDGAAIDDGAVGLAHLALAAPNQRRQQQRVHLARLRLRRQLGHQLVVDDRLERRLLLQERVQHGNGVVVVFLFFVRR